MPLTKIQSLGITDGTIVNADINASAAIAGTKLTGVGKVLQVVTATDATQRSTTSTSFVTASNTLSVTITPASASNKVFLLCTTVSYGVTAGAVHLTIFRGSTNIGAGTQNGFTENRPDWNSSAFSYLDSPSTTSATTYQIRFRSDNGGLAYMNNDTLASITAFEIAA